MIRILLFLLSMLTVNKPGYREALSPGQGGPYRRSGGGAVVADPGTPAGPEDGPDARTELLPAGQPSIGPPSGGAPADRLPAGGDRPGGHGGYRRPWRRRIPRRVRWLAVLLIVVLFFRRILAWTALVALSAVLHVAGVNMHLPHVRFGWPWQAISASTTTTNVNVGPMVLQKIEGISRPALGRANFNFIFTHKVSKSIGPWPCWYASTFDAVGHASATVDLNPGPSWWAPGLGHYQLHVLSRPQGGSPGRVSVTMFLPRPQLPQSAHDVTIDNLPSKPISVQHSWTYPGFGCGTLLRPQFADAVLYAQAQSIAFYKSTHAPGVIRPLIGTAEAEATQTIRDNFIQPALNGLGYTLSRFNIRWVSGP